MLPVVLRAFDIWKEIFLYLEPSIIFLLLKSISFWQKKATSKILFSRSQGSWAVRTSLGKYSLNFHCFLQGLLWFLKDCFLKPFSIKRNGWWMRALVMQVWWPVFSPRNSHGPLISICMLCCLHMHMGPCVWTQTHTYTKQKRKLLKACTCN